MSDVQFALVFFFYGLAFFSMGLAILLELNKCSDPRLRHALRPLAAFGFIHGAHEWIEMFERLNALPFQDEALVFWDALRLMFLAFSFLSLGAFGASLLARNEAQRRVSMVLPLTLTGLWGLGLLALRQNFTADEIVTVTDVWTRYVLAIPSALIACVGLVVQQREFRQAGLAKFGRDSLWAAVSFFWYGVIGQTFVKTSSLPPSNVINQDLFLRLFSFPVQIMRAATAILAAFFVMRFLRSFEVEINNRIATLQAARLEEAERREALRGDLLRRIVAAQEAERQRIARELHDETGQALTALGLGLRGIGGSLHSDPEKASGNLRQLESLVDHSLNELQRLIADLRPSHLDDLGLAATLRWYAGEVQKRVPLKISFEFHGEQRPLPAETRTALFRIAQEAITNTIKHAQAQNIFISLDYGDQQILLRVSDDGRGFDPNDRLRSNRRPSWGLLGICERAALLGGHCEIQSTPGLGTQIEVVIPYQPKTWVEENEHSLIAG